MAEAILNGNQLGNGLSELMDATDITPGDQPSYNLCKQIYAFHPLGAKMVDVPIQIAQSQAREISVPEGPEEKLTEAFAREWEAIGADKHIANLGRLARMYGVASLAIVADGVETTSALDYEALADLDLSFNSLDPLNTAGSLLLNQDPNDPLFQHVRSISANGVAYHRSRTVTLLNEQPLYIEYVSSGFAYSGRSVYQRALFPLKSYINTLLTDDMVSFKAGVLIEKLQQNSSATDALMQGAAGVKRNFVKQARVGNVITIGADEDVASIDLAQLEGPYALARKNILDNIATAGGMPAILLNQETFAEGLSDGTEDAKMVATFVDGVRVWLAPAYEFFTKVVQYRAWNARFYKTIQAQFPEYEGVAYKAAFYAWRNSFVAKWPSLLVEPDSELVKVDDVKLKALIAQAQVFLPIFDPQNKAALIQAIFDNMNEMKLLFSTPFTFDADSFMSFAEEQQQQQAEALKSPDAAPPFSARDSIAEFTGAVARLTDRKRAAS